MKARRAAMHRPPRLSWGDLIMGDGGCYFWEHSWARWVRQAQVRDDRAARIAVRELVRRGFLVAHPDQTAELGGATATAAACSSSPASSASSTSSTWSFHARICVLVGVSCGLVTLLALLGLHLPRLLGLAALRLVLLAPGGVVSDASGVPAEFPASWVGLILLALLLCLRESGGGGGVEGQAAPRPDTAAAAATAGGAAGLGVGGGEVNIAPTNKLHSFLLEPALLIWGVVGRWCVSLAKWGVVLILLGGVIPLLLGLLPWLLLQPTRGEAYETQVGNWFQIWNTGFTIVAVVGRVLVIDPQRLGWLQGHFLYNLGGVHELRLVDTVQKIMPTIVMLADATLLPLALAHVVLRLVVLLSPPLPSSSLLGLVMIPNLLQSQDAPQIMQGVEGVGWGGGGVGGGRGAGVSAVEVNLDMVVQIWGHLVIMMVFLVGMVGWWGVGVMSRWVATAHKTLRDRMYQTGERLINHPSHKSGNDEEDGSG